MSGNYIRKDHLYQQAKSEGYRSRASYKLLELDKRYKLFQNGMTVCDLGCAPGGWLQVAAAKVGRNGKVVGIDLQEVEPLAGDPTNVCLLRGNFCSADMRQQLIAQTGGKVDILLSDMAPNISGIRLKDSYLSAELVEQAWMFAHDVVRPGGMFVAKIFPGQECEELTKKIRPSFKKFSRPVLDSSRKSSTELYFVGQGFVRSS